jgi:uncharacterized protein YggU (UPF0235/DUF167 family)
VRAATGGGARALVAVRVTPGAGATVVGGVQPGRYGPALLVRVGAPAVDGRATAAALRAVARALGVRPADVTLHQGATSRDKLFAVAGPPADLAARLAVLHGQDPRGQLAGRRKE